MIELVDDVVVMVIGNGAAASDADGRQQAENLEHAASVVVVTVTFVVTFVRVSVVPDVVVAGVRHVVQSVVRVVCSVVHVLT